MKRDEGEWEVANRALMIPHSVSQLQIKTKKKKHTKTKEEPWTSKQFNWKRWMLQVCGWLGVLAMIYLFNNAPNDFPFLHSLLRVLNLGELSRYIRYVAFPIRHILKQVDKLKLPINPVASFYSVSFSGLGERDGWKGVRMTRWRKDISVGNPSQANGGTEHPRC